MENKENKIKAVRLSDDELENVSGGELVVASLAHIKFCAAELNDDAADIEKDGSGPE